MPTAEEANAAMAIIAKLQAAYEDGGTGIPPGADWVDSAFAYLEHAGIYSDEAAATQLLQGYGILSEAPPPAPPPPTFVEAMDLPEWWESFRAFTATEYSSENPDFLDAVRFQSMGVRDIYDTYVKADAEQQVNIGAAGRTAIDEAFGNGDEPGYDVFETATDEIVRMASGDTWRRFLLTQGQ